MTINESQQHEHYYMNGLLILKIFAYSKIRRSQNSEFRLFPIFKSTVIMIRNSSPTNGLSRYVGLYRALKLEYFPMSQYLRKFAIFVTYLSYRKSHLVEEASECFSMSNSMARGVCFPMTSSLSDDGRLRWDGDGREPLSGRLQLRGI